MAWRTTRRFRTRRKNLIFRTGLDAKGLVDEHDPLAFGVVGVHGKPGLEHAAALVSTAELVLAFGVEDHSLLLCDNQCTKLFCGATATH